MKNYYFLLTFLSLFFTQSIFAQISFTNRNDLLTKSDFHSGGPVGVVDMNDDGKDDIVRMDQGYQLNFEFQNGFNSAFTNTYIGDLNNGSNWSMCAADIHNSGFASVMADGALANADATGTNFSIFNMTGSGFFIQGTNFADINNDGWLDAFACNDNGESGIWGNDGTGNLILQNDWIDMSVDGSSGEPASGNYGSIWTDFDNDGDIDLYIAKCRQGITDPADKRRINVLYVNDGNGNYTEMGAEYGLRIDWQSWTADFQDVNNDGWLDVFILNHDHQAQIFLNDGTGHYTELDNTGINVGGFPLQGVMRDFDNDGFVDAIISGSNSQIFRNNGDSTFTEVMDVFNNNSMLSYALGDLNGDGFIDAYSSYGTGYTTPTNTDDVLWMNDGNDNNHLSVHLQGTISNRDAVGARIEIYGEWGIQIREVRSGESYGIMNSMNQYFGLGTATAIDSMIVRWPSGVVQTEYDLEINSFVQILEGGCLAANPSIATSGATTFCTGETVELIAPGGYDTYEWSNGAMTESIVVSEAGSYKLTVTDTDGCLGFSTSISVVVDPVLNPEIVAEGILTFCEGESVELSEIATTDATNYTWSNGAMGSTVEITESGTYTVAVEGLCQDFTSNEIIVIVNDIPDAPTVAGQTIAPNTSADLSTTGNDLHWYDVAMGGDPIAVGENFMTPILIANTTYYVEDRNGFEGLDARVGKEEHSGTPYPGDPNRNEGIIFDALEEFTLDSVTMYTDIEAMRRIVVYDGNFMEVASKEVMVPTGKSTIHLGFDIPKADNLYMSTDGVFNLNNLNVFGPFLQRSDSNVNYPYTVSDFVSINSSSVGENWYYYFYDWQISTPDQLCISERTAVEVVVDESLAAVDISKSADLNVFPNPTNGDLAIDLKFDLTDEVDYKISDIAGRTVLENQLDQPMTVVSLKHLPKGIYTLQIVHKDKLYQGRIILQ